MKKTRVLVCGGRHYSNEEHVERVLDAIVEEFGPVVIIEGEASGADALAKAWAKKHGYDVDPFAPNWKVYGRAAGPIRNAKMLEKGKPDFVVAFPGNDGTNDMVTQARAAGMEVLDRRRRR